ncbi:MAG: ABC transporter permease [Candidatus Gastranaerophilales bacterium]|nr:ABC transporter permease [Candidatus Gastranaerophilales bacterium]
MKILFALIKKEFLQIIRDPSSIVISFVLPFILLIIYMYGINLDTTKVSIGIKNDDMNPEISTLIKSFSRSKFVKSDVYYNPAEMYDDIVRSKLNGAVLIPNDFSSKLAKGQAADFMVITDGSTVNTANYVQSYPLQIVNDWLAQSEYARFVKPPAVSSNIRFWYNQDINSHYFILPGSLAITMTLIGLLLTALVVAREWERGTMEALLSTQVRKIDIVLGKYIPYFTLGMLSMIFNTFVCIYVFHIPFRGSLFVLFAVSGLFLFTSLGIGLLISTSLKNQFVASQVAIAIGFLPALLMSGLMFPINSMPIAFQYFTMILPPRYFVTFIESEFMAGTVWSIVIANSLFLLVLGSILFAAVYEKTGMRLEEDA